MGPHIKIKIKLENFAQGYTHTWAGSLYNKGPKPVCRVCPPARPSTNFNHLVKFDSFALVLVLFISQGLELFLACFQVSYQLRFFSL